MIRPEFITLLTSIAVVAIGYFFMFKYKNNSSSPISEDSLKKIADLENQLEQTKQKLAQSEVIVSLYDQEVNRVKELSQTLEQERKDFNQQILELNNSISTLNTQKSHLEAKNQELEEQVTKLNDQHKQLITEQSEKYEKQINELKEEKTKISTDYQQEVDKLKEEYKNDKNQIDTDHKQDIQNLTNTFNEQLSNIRNDHKNALGDLQEQLKSQRNEFNQEKNTLVEQNEQKSQKITELTKENTKLKGEVDNFNNVQSQLKANIELLSQEIIAKKGEDLANKNQELISHTINPLKEDLNKFLTFVSNFQNTSYEKFGALNNEINKLLEAQASLSQQANDLSTALRTNAKAQGCWGEFQLEVVLEAAGLIKNVNYLREVDYKDPKNNISGRRDAIITLPANKGVVIDSKCSLVAYLDYIKALNDNDLKEQQNALDKLFISVKKHIEELAAKDYSSYKDFNCPPFVLMFIPIEQAFSLVLQKNPSLYTYARDKKIYLVSPYTLLPALHIVSTLWTMSVQNIKFKKLVELAQSISKKTEVVSSKLLVLEKQINNTSNQFNDLKQSLFSGRGNLIKLLNSFADTAPVISKELQQEFTEETDQEYLQNFNQVGVELVEQIPFIEKKVKSSGRSSKKEAIEQDKSTDVHEVEVIELKQSSEDNTAQDEVKEEVTDNTEENQEQKVS